MTLKRFPTSGPWGWLFKRLNEWAAQIERGSVAHVTGSLTSITTRGTIQRTKPGKAARGIGLLYRGEYIPAEQYDIGDLVVIREVISGATSGAYICVKDNPGQANPPQDGIYWVCLTKTDTLGVWR